MEASVEPNLASRGVVALALAGTAAVGAWWLHGHPPSADGWYPSCFFHTLTGLHCPGCGATRAAYALLHGRVTEALHQNALATLALPFLGLTAGRALWRWTRGQAVPAPAEPSRWIARLALMVAPVVILFGIVRNLPWAPFTALAPY